MPKDPGTVWPHGAKSAVSLAFVGRLPERLEGLITELDSFGFKATFFVNPPSVLRDPNRWRELAAQGHEIGNASLYEVSLNGELPNWTLRTVEQDLHMTQEFLEDMFPDQNRKLFVVPGEVTTCADGDYRDLVNSRFDCVVGAKLGSNDAKSDPKDLRVVHAASWLEGLDPQNAEGWSILVITGREEVVLDRLKDANIWVAPVGTVADHLLTAPEGATL